jgi:hypothetical protein
MVKKIINKVVFEIVKKASFLAVKRNVPGSPSEEGLRIYFLYSNG